MYFKTVTVSFLISIFFGADPLHFLKDLVIGSNSFLVFLSSHVVLNSMYASLAVLIQFKRYKVLSLSISFPDTMFNRFLLPDISKGFCVSAINVVIWVTASSSAYVIASENS